MTYSSLWQRGLLSLSFIYLVVSSGLSQCCISSPSVIPDNDYLTLGFSVSGLTNANLASPAQGICGVDISFNHEYLGDLTITLISPSGTSVQLIGPTTTATLPTNLTTWNIHFVPCGGPANPDAGFTDTWSNLQDWQALTTYTGSYYPATGCLEDFNIGSANGQWLIIVQDHDIFQLGNIISICLLFCDPTGLNCSECIPNAGVLSPSSFDRCAGENIQSSEVSVNFGNNVPSPLHYGYQYLLVAGTNILESGISFSAILPAGSYTLCGLSYLLDDSTNVNALLAAGDLSGLQQDIASGVICGDLTNICIPVEIAAPPDTVIVSTNLCQGEVFSYGGQNYTSTGTFYQVHDGPGMCDSIFEIRIAPRTLSVVIPEPDTLFCNNPIVSLSAITGGANGPFSFQWMTTYGNITSSSMLPSITVDQAGPYDVAVTDGICIGSASTEVHADQGFPQIFVDGSSITCKQPTVDLTPVYIPSNGAVMWTGPMGFMSNQPNITTSIPGIYKLTITNSEGCTTTKEININIDTITYPIDLFELARYCQSNQAILIAATGLPMVTYSWSGPNNFTSNSYTPIVSDAGLYSATVTFTNGCQSTASYYFDGDFTIPDIMVPPSDTLNCSEVLSLTVNSLTPGASYIWQWPVGNTVGQATIQIQDPGNYNAYVISPNGCHNSAIVEIVQGPDVFPYQVFYDTLDCLHPTVSIGVVSMQADVFHWLNYAGPDSDQSSIQVSTSGIYTVMMKDTNSQCELMVSIYVPSNFVTPNFGYVLDTISCNDPFANLSFIPYAGETYSNVYWELPDLTTQPGPVLVSDLPGTYFLNAVGSNGCIGVQFFDIPVDTLAPFLLIETDSITCNDTARIEAKPITPVVAYNWSGAAILSDMGNAIEVTHGGIYTLVATGLNGCVFTANVLVDSNYTLPVFSLVLDTLRCDMPATLSAVTGDSILQYHWYDPLGMLIDSDSTTDVSNAGTYTFDIQGSNRCIAYDTLVVDPAVYPVISITTDTFTCTLRTASLFSHIDIQPTSIAWVDTNSDTISHADQVVVSDPGPFYLVVTGPNGCMTTDTASVPSDSTAPQAIINLIGEVKCKVRDVTFDGSGSLPSSIIFNWSTVGGNILSNQTLPVIDARDTGLYQLIVTIPKTGCSDTANYQLLPNPDEITQTMLSIKQPKCNGDVNGAISLTEVSGGIEPFLYQLNGGPPQTDTLFEHLVPGMYLITINDATGCEYDTLVNIPTTNAFVVDAGPDVEIHIGETVTLSGSTDLINADIQNETWDSLGVELCTNCPDFEVSPQETAMYTFLVTSVTGCVVQDELTVFVVEEGKFYIPNVFSPNGDNINDEVRISPTPGIQKVLQWVIFDRWGDAVYGKLNFDPNDPTVFWDGRTSTGDFSNPGVFAYLLEIQLINGNVELHHGNITLIR